MRVVGVDPGTRRVGVAVSDDDGRLALPHTVLDLTGDAEADRAALAALVGALGAEVVVVGLPLSLDGSVGPAARWATEEADALAALVDVPVELHDERLSSVTAARRPERQDGARRPERQDGARRPERQDGARRPERHRLRQRLPVDGEAAAVMLQSWLDAHRSRPARPEPA